MAKIFQRYKLEISFGTLIFLLALLLRVYNITILPIFADEAIYIRWAQIMRSEPTLRFLPLSDGKQPLFMWSIIPFLKIISDPLIAGRLTSVFFGLFGLVGLFLLTHRLFGTKVALFSSLLYAVSPFFVFFDRIALVDSMLSAFGIYCLYFGILTAQTLRLDFAIFAGFAAGAAYLTKSPAIFFFALLPTTALLFKPPRTGRFFAFAKLFGLYLVSWVIGFAIYNILRLGPGFNMIALRNKDYVFSLQEVSAHILDPFLPHIKEIVEWLLTLSPWTVIFFGIIAVVLFWRKYKLIFLVLCLWSLLPLLIQAEFAKVFTSRYILFTVPPLFVLAGLGLAADNYWKKIFWPVLSVALFVPLYFDWLLLVSPQVAPLPRDMRRGYLEEWTAGTGIREIASFLQEQATAYPNQKIVVGTEGFFGTLPQGLEIYFDKSPNVIIKGIGVPVISLDPSLIAAKKAGNRVFLVVNSSRFKISPYSNQQLILLNSYPKAESPEKTRESLLFFELR